MEHKIPKNTFISDVVPEKELYKFIKRLYKFSDCEDEELDTCLDLYTNKIVSTNGILPGDRVKITWCGSMEGIIDYGYVFTLPTQDNEDVLMSGVVHIPLPQEDKCSGEPQWWILPALLALPDLKTIHFYR